MTRATITGRPASTGVPAAPVEVPSLLIPARNPATACGVIHCTRMRGHDGFHREADESILEGPIRSWATER